MMSTDCSIASQFPQSYDHSQYAAMPTGILLLAHVRAGPKAMK